MLERDFVQESLAPVAIPAAYEVVAAQLRRAIHLGHIGVGDRLPAERELAQRLGVSRVTLREALRMLEGSGYVQTRRGPTGGPFVAKSQESQAQLRARLAERIDEFDEIRDFRIVAEGRAAALAAERHTEDDLLRLHGAVDALREDVDIVAFRRADSAFHLLVAETSGNRILRRTIEDAREQCFAMMAAVEFRIELASSRKDHQAILRAIERGNARGAERAMAKHIERSHAELRVALGLDAGGESE